MALTPQEVDRFRADGHVTPAWRLPAATLSAMRGWIDCLIADNPDQRPEQLVCPHIKGGIDGGLHIDDGLSAAFLDIAHMPAIVDMVEQLIGPDIIFWGSQLFCKRAGDGLAVPWHQDGHYWPIRPLAACSVWVAVDRSGPDNGCLRVASGSHRSGLIDHATGDADNTALDQALDAGAVDERTVADVVLEPGQVSLHDVFLIHGSDANRSDRRRAGFVLRYMPATSLFDRSAPDYVGGDGHRVNYAERPIWLVRGVNRHPANIVQ